MVDDHLSALIWTNVRRLRLPIRTTPDPDPFSINLWRPAAASAINIILPDPLPPTESDTCSQVRCSYVEVAHDAGGNARHQPRAHCGQQLRRHRREERPQLRQLYIAGHGVRDECGREQRWCWSLHGVAEAVIRTRGGAPRPQGCRCARRLHLRRAAACSQAGPWSSRSATR